MNEFYWTWEAWFAALKDIARREGYSERGILTAFEENEPCWREMYDEEMSPMTAFIEGTYE